MTKILGLNWNDKQVRIIKDWLGDQVVDELIRNESQSQQKTRIFPSDRMREQIRTLQGNLAKQQK
mgnify:CR=1 FL=1